MTMHGKERIIYISVKNKFFTQKFVLVPKFPGYCKNRGLIYNKK